MTLSREKKKIIDTEKHVLGLKPSQVNFVVDKANYILSGENRKWKRKTEIKAQVNNRHPFAQALHEAAWVLRKDFENWDDNLATYLEVSGEEIKEFKTVGKVFKRPTEKDYKKGWCWRHFICRFNDTHASEVTADFFKKEFDNLPKGLYKKKKIRWYIKEGINHEKEDLFETVNAASLNRSNIMKASKDMPQLIRTMKNFSEFVR